jgi:oligoendopeptidase F
MGHHLSRNIRKNPYNDNIDDIKRKELIRYLDEMDKQLKSIKHELYDKGTPKPQPSISYQTNKNYIFDKDL